MSIFRSFRALNMLFGAALAMAIAAPGFSQSCGDPAAGDCCIANGTPFCDDTECCDAICAADPFCCDTQWDQICADAAVAGCAACGGGGGDCTIEVCGTGGPCDQVHPDPGCDDVDCCCLVCEFNAFCCDVEWDASCVDDANALCGGGNPGCGDPASGSCCIANGTPFCDDADCCNQICAADPFCCDTQWDGICASAAATQCTACGAAPCDAGECSGSEDVNEDEACGTDINGGCNSTPPVYTELGSLGVGETVTICGNTWADNNTRDTDWYLFTLTEFSTVTWTVNGGGVDPTSPGAPTIGFVITGSCPAAVIAVSSGTCPSEVSACLPAGTYSVFAGLSVFAGFPCPGVPYTAALTVNPPDGCPEPPANDTCVNAVEIFEGETAFSTENAFTDGPPLSAGCTSFGSNQIFNDIWYTWTAPCDGEIVISTCNTASFDTRLAVYVGDCETLSEGDEVACNDDGPGCTGFTSRLEFQSFKGLTYLIRLGAFGATQTGTGTLLLCGCDIECPAAPGCGSPDAGGCDVANGTPFCDDEACCDLVCAADAFCCDVAWDQICADEALTLCYAVPCETAQNCPPDSIPEGEPCGEDTNGGCNNPGDLVTYIAPGDTICGTFWADNNTRDTDWYEFTVDVDSDVTWQVYADIDIVAFLINATCPPAIIGTDDAGICPTTVTTCLPAGTYRAFVALPLFGGVPCGGTLNNYTAVLTATPTKQCGLDNDQCDGAIEIQTGDTPFSNVGSFTDGPALPAECDSFGSVTMYNDIWFKWVSDTTGEVAVFTCNQASFDTRLAAYVGECEALELVGCNDDSTGCAGFTSRMDLLVDEGVTYYIRVGSFGATQQGSGTLTIGEGGSTTPENDDCTGAFEVFDGVTGINNFNATTGVPQPPAATCTFFGNPNVYNDVWYTYTPTCNGSVTVAFCAANGGSATFDTKLAVWTGPDCDNLTNIACNDDSCGLQSLVTFDAECEQSYYIQFGAYSTVGFGAGNMSIACSGGDKCDPSGIPGDLNGDGIVNAADLNILLAAWGTDDPIADINGDGIVNAADLNILLSNWSV